MQPSISQKDRIVSLDIIRGLALFGILFINVPAFVMVVEGMVLPKSTSVDQWIDLLINIFIEKKFFSMFSFLFGFGFYIFTSRAEQRGDNPRKRFARRLIILFLFGIVHFFIFFGSILVPYALIGFFLLPFYNLSTKAISKWLTGIVSLFVTAILAQMIFGTDMPIAKYVTNDTLLIFIMFLAGFLTAKADWVRHLGNYKRQIWLIQLITFALSVLSSVFIWKSGDGNEPLQMLDLQLNALAMTPFYLVTLFSLLEHRWLQKACMPLARVGQMALTNYVAQSIIGLQLMAWMGIEFPTSREAVLIACMIFGIQVIFSVVWFRFFRMGPLEKLWRVMTYGRQGKIVKKAS
ncbi:DUF418 domain-containing protein [Bacillus sp. FJAT-52991]|uniref:DUF418 domain-containing protein n=1 Tax=Bacillus kandeliae TaxID=3129297 RepID=A0ABZ2N5V5_9BACI